MNHEGFNFYVDVFDKKTICNDPKDLWSANNAIPNLLFDNQDKFHSKIPFFKIEHHSYDEFLCFLNSGGVTSKTFHIPMSHFFLNILNFIDKFLVMFFPKIFCMGRRVVLKKKN